MGTIGAPHGIHGWVRVSSAASLPESLCENPVWILRNLEEECVELHLEDSNLRHSRLIVKFRDADSREAAEKLRGLEILVERSQLKPLEKDCFYWCDLIGMSVHSSEGEDFGRVMDMMRLPSNDVLVVKRGGGEMLVPFLKDYVQEVDFAKRLIIANWRSDY